MISRAKEAKKLQLHRGFWDLLEAISSGDPEAPSAKEGELHLIPICMGLTQGICSHPPCTLSYQDSGGTRGCAHLRLNHGYQPFCAAGDNDGEGCRWQ